MKLSLCNEVLAHLTFEQQCAYASALGYQALELAPFTLAADPFNLDEAAAKHFMSIAHDHGLVISSLHWLLVKPEALSLVSRNTALRQTTLSLLHRLIDFASACEAQVLVHGSPKQRNPEPGQSHQEALGLLQEGLADLAPHAQTNGVVYCIEPLAPFETSVINTLAEASGLVDAIGSPALRTMFDASAASHAEQAPLAEVLVRYLKSGHIAHIQVNDKNRRAPGQGNTDIAALLSVLKAQQYTGWIAVEPFDYVPNGEASASFAAGYLSALLRQLG